MKIEFCKRCEDLFELHNPLDSNGLCGHCDKELRNKVHPILRMLTRQANENYSTLERGKIYGTIAEDIYDKCCTKFGWDKSQTGKFAKQKRLYGETKIDDEIYGIWFLAHSNMTGTIQKDERWANQVDENNNKLLYMFIDKSEKIESNRVEKRIIFAKDQYARYIFLGCYKRIRIEDNGYKEVYEMFSPIYPII